MNCTWSNARIIVHCTHYFTTFEANLHVLIAAHNAWSSLELQLKCRYWCCCFVSSKRNPGRRRKLSGCPIFTGKARGSVKHTQPSSNEVTGDFTDIEKKGRHLNIYPIDGFFMSACIQF